MAFKNAFKNLVAHFGTVWAILLYMIIFAALIIGLSLPFVLPIINAFSDAGVFEAFAGAFGALFGDGGFSGLWDGLYKTYVLVADVLEYNGTVAELLKYFFIVIVIVAFRFFFGLHEIPLATVIDGRMSCDARYGLGGKFFSTLSVSVRYSAAKLVIGMTFDFVMCMIIYGFGVWLGFGFIFVIAAMLTLSVFISFKNTMLACWAPCVVNGSGVIKGFGRSVAICFKRFGSIFSTYFVSLLLLMSIGLFVSLFTLGIGLIIVLPFITVYYGYLNVTQYYNKTGRRYYINGVIFTPPTENVL